MSKRTLLYVLLTALFLIGSAYQGRFIQRRLQALTDRENLVLNQVETSASGRITFLSKAAEAAGIRKGDLLLSVEGHPYTGRGVISEAMNPDEEEWGEEQLVETAKACEGLSAADTIAFIVEAADRFANGAKQHDDMTLMVVRIV
jgi:hypothetical protein